MINETARFTPQKKIEGPNGPIFDVAYHEPKDSAFPYLKIESAEGIRRIPVYDVRDTSHHNQIAKVIVSGRPIAFEVGVMGIMIAVNDPRTGDDNWNQFWQVKRGRAPKDKIPIMMHPRDQYKIVKYDELHPDFHFLKDPQKRMEFFDKLPFHTILPYNENDRTVNRNAFVTTPEDSKQKPKDQYVPLSTVCLYFQGGDKVWGRIAEIAKGYNPYVYPGISSLNDHGEQSPYDFNEFLTYCKKKQRVDVEAVIRDETVRKAEIKSSYTQVRLPLKHEKPEIVVVRRGSISADTLSQFTGFPVRVLESATLASRGHPADVKLDNRILKYLDEINDRERGHRVREKAIRPPKNIRSRITHILH